MKKLALILTLAALTLGIQAQTFKAGTTDAVKAVIPLMEKVLKEAGLDPVISTLPQPRLLAQLGDGSLDGGFFLNDPMFQSVKGLVKVSVPLYKNDIVAVTIKPEIKITGPADLKNYKVGIIRGAIAQESLTKDMKPQVADNEVAEFKMLAAGRFEVALISRVLVATTAKSAGISGVIVQEPAVFSAPLYFGLTASKAALATKLAQIFKKWVESGEWGKELNAIFDPLNG